MSIQAIPGGVRLHLHVQPGASRTEVAGLHGDRIRLRVAAPPLDGRANDEVTRWLATRCRVPRRCVRLVGGVRSRMKVVEIDGVNEAEVRALLG